MIRIGINGFGRIGRRLFRLLSEHEQIEVVAINDIAPSNVLAHLLKYDSIHGVIKHKISTQSNSITVNSKVIPVLHETTPNTIEWSVYNVDIVVECSGKFKTIHSLKDHIQNGATKVILSVPPQDESIKTIVLGVNDDSINPKDTILSNASCTTNNAAPMVDVINTLCGIEQAYVTTVHSFTTDQSLHDEPHKDLRRARAAGQSIVPTTTGAAKALTKIFPHIAANIGGCGIRVPVINGSLTDITFNVKKACSVKNINTAFKIAAESKKYNGIIEYTEDPIVSVDVIGNTHSCIFDAQMTSVIGKMVKIIGWYDNETAYSSRIIDLILKIYKL